jgi:O-antigen/teichoic acid export membrane protein
LDNGSVKQSIAADKDSLQPAPFLPAPLDLEDNVRTPFNIAAGVTSPGKSLGWRVLTNTASQVIGRNFIALGRLVVAGIIARGFGKGIFGEYSLVFTLLIIAEWVLDFGTTEIFVRDICRESERQQLLMRIFTAAKLVQIPVAFGVLAAILFALRYPSQVVEAGLVGGVGLVFFAGVLVYRVIFKSSLTMEREMGAELASVLAMIPLVIFLSRHGGGLVGLLICHLVSRFIFFAACFVLGRNSFRISIKGVTWSDVLWGLKSSSAIGVIDILLLSRLGTLSDLAYYSAAQRFTMPLLIALASIGATLYPIASTCWPQAPKRFEQACQQGFDTVFLIAGLAITAMLAGPQFFMGLIGPSMLAGVPVLRVLAALCFVKAVSSALGPVLYVLQAQTKVLQIVVLSVTMKAAILAILAPRYGALGVAYGAVAVELCFTAIPAMFLIQRYSGCRLSWTVPLKVLLATFIAMAMSRFLPSPKGLLAAIAAVGAYVGLVFLVRAASLTNVRTLLHRNAG